MNNEEWLQKTCRERELLSHRTGLILQLNCSVPSTRKKSKSVPSLHITFYVLMYMKSLISLGFCDIWKNKGIINGATCLSLWLGLITSIFPGRPQPVPNFPRRRGSTCTRSSVGYNKSTLQYLSQIVITPVAFCKSLTHLSQTAITLATTYYVAI